jgi:CheY-like chemotaxis protein
LASQLLSRLSGLHHDEAQDTIRVLHVDNEPEQIRPAKLFIEKADPAIQIDLVSSLKKAQHLLQQQSYDCVFSDYLFTGMNGVELARIVKETNNIPFIIYTGQNEEDMGEVVFATEIDDYIRKEFNPNHYLMLAKKIRAIVERYRVKKRLQELEKWFRDIAEHSYDVIFKLDK